MPMPHTKTALIFGITGQTGSYLAEHLLRENYIVHGVIRRSSTFNTERLKDIFMVIRDNLHYGDVIDTVSVLNLIKTIAPDEIYNLAAQSHVKVSFDMPHYTTQVDAIGTLNILEAIRLCGFESRTKFYQANTSEMFGGHEEDYSPNDWESILQYGMSEKTPMFPKSPYGAAKLYSHHLVKIYRDSYGIFAVSGICFNHESERRDPRFLPRKVTRSVAMIKSGKQEVLLLGNLNAERDWGYAPDYAKAIYSSLQCDTPSDLVIATGKTYPVRYLVEVAFKTIGKTIVWRGEEMDEEGVDADTGKILVKVDPKFYRPNEVHYLKGNASLAKEKLLWEPSVSFEEMITNMVKHDVQRITEEDPFSLLEHTVS